MNRSLGPFLLLLMFAVASPHATAQSLNHHLLRAAARGDSAAVAWAIARGADVNACVRLDPYADDLPISDTLGGIVAPGPADARPALQKVVERLKAGEVQGIKEKVRAGLVEELEDCLAKVAAAADEGDRFHFCVVM